MAAAGRLNHPRVPGRGIRGNAWAVETETDAFAVNILMEK
jgi:hypothetical protein